MSREWDWMDDFNEENYPLKKAKRIKNEYKRNKIKNNRSRTRSGDTADQGGEGGYY
mgnify:FL=1|tara:strand:+ start:380 stop:547 length:168 start_codon:yes stop_codon:yes gene_type:complete